MATTQSQSPKTALPEVENTRFPSDLIDPEKKGTLEFMLQYFRAAYNLHKRNGGMYTLSRRDDWIENRKYAEGNQSTKKYINWLTKLKNSQNEPLSYMDLDYSIISTAPKVMSVVLSIMEKTKHKVGCDAINPLAERDRQRAKNKLWAKSLLAPFMAQMAQKAGQPDLAAQPDDYIPQTKKELDAWMQNGFRLPNEIAFELAIEGVKLENNYAEEEKLIRKDMLFLGCAGTCTDIDPVSKKILTRATDPVNMILMDFRGHNGSNMSRIGEIRKMTIAQIRMAAGSQFTEEEYYDMAKAYCGYWNNPDSMVPYSDYINTDNQYGKYRTYDTMEVYVMDMDYDSVDTMKWEKKNVAGNEFTFKKPYKTPVEKTMSSDGLTIEKEVYATETRTVYTGKWVIGTNFMWDYGRLTNISRSSINPSVPIKRYKFYRVANKSILELIIPYLDSLQLTWLKVQNLKARAIPKGFAVEVGAFENVYMSGRKMTPQELLQMAFQTGIIVWRRTSLADDEGFDNTTKPIEPMEGGMGAEFRELMESMMNDIAMIREITGINDIVDSTAPDPNQPVGTAQFARESASNAIFPIISACKTLDSLTSRDILEKIRMIVKYTGSFNTYIPSIGETAAKYVEIGMQDSLPYAFDLRIEDMPTEDQKQQLLVAAQEALKSSQDPTKGGIEYKDYLQITRLLNSNVNLKMIEMILTARIEDYKLKMQRMADDSSKANAQNLMMVEQQKIQLADQAADKQLQRDKERIAFETDQKIREIRETKKLETANDIVNSGLTVQEKMHESNLQNQVK